MTIPAELPVTVGAPGRGMAVLTFTPADASGEVSCRYQGNGRGLGGDRYVLQRCTGGGATVSAGDEVDVSAMSLRVQNGDPTSPGGTYQTTVSVDLHVVPLTFEEPERDYYRIAVFSPDGTDYLDVSGRLSSGDFVIDILD